MTREQYETMFIVDRFFEAALRRTYGVGHETAARYNPALNRATPELRAAHDAYVNAQRAAFACGAAVA